MTYLAQYQFAGDPTFQTQILQAIVVAAENVSSELNTTPNHANRIVLAKSVMNNPATWVLAFAQGVAANGTYTSAQSDANILTQVSAIWNAMSGVV